jgi:hypothetical protein
MLLKSLAETRGKQGDHCHGHSNAESEAYDKIWPIASRVPILRISRIGCTSASDQTEITTGGQYQFQTNNASPFGCGCTKQTRHVHGSLYHSADCAFPATRYNQHSLRSRLLKVATWLTLLPAFPRNTKKKGEASAKFTSHKKLALYNKDNKGSIGR